VCKSFEFELMSDGVDKSMWKRLSLRLRMSDTHNVQQFRRAVEQLRRERNIRRSQVSACAMDLCRFVQEYQKDDNLLAGFGTDKLNPYRPKNSFRCTML